MTIEDKTKNYEHLREKRIIGITPGETKKDECYIAAIEVGKGISIKYMNKEGYFLCLNSKENKNFNKRFDWIVEQIESGIIDGNKDPFNNNLGILQASCAFI